jgi:hypothetical protein
VSKNIQAEDAATIDPTGTEYVEAASENASIAVFSYDDFVSFQVTVKGRDAYVDMTVEQALEFAAKIGEIANAVAERESSL